MRSRAVALVPVLVLATAQGRPPTYPLPPVPPAQPPPATTWTPNRELTPLPADGGQAPLTLDMNVHRRDPPLPGQGFLPGSAWRDGNDRRFPGPPGVQFHIPFP